MAESGRWMQARIPLTGYSISLVWRRMHPGVYFVIGLGMSIAAACVFLGIFFAICFALFAGYNR